MKVKELIKKLKKYPEDLEVELADENTGICPVKISDVCEELKETGLSRIIIYSDMVGT